MRAVWSLRASTAPATGWPTDRAQLLGWVLSVMSARAHFDATALVTDTRGRAVLADALGLPFDEVTTGLDDAPPAASPRLRAIAAQRGPFVHLDPDVFLWQPLPAAVVRAPVFAQNPIAPDLSRLRTPDRSEGDEPVTVPPDWPATLRWAASQPPGAAIDLSFVGANFLAFMQRFAAEADRFVGERLSAAGGEDTAEGALLAAFLAYHRQAGESDAAEITYLFESAEAAENSPRAAAVGYTRLGAAGRADAELARRVERRVARDYPEQYRRCLRLLAAWRGW